MTDPTTTGRLREDVSAADPETVPAEGGVDNPESDERNQAPTMAAPWTDAADEHIDETPTTGIDEAVQDDIERPGER